jgi:hypothetical protein
MSSNNKNATFPSEEILSRKVIAGQSIPGRFLPFDHVGTILSEGKKPTRYSIFWSLILFHSIHIFAVG